VDGFSVDVKALSEAAAGITELVGMLREHKVSDNDCDSAAVGHDGLADKLASFCSRWQVGWRTWPRTARGSQAVAGVGQGLRRPGPGDHEGVSRRRVGWLSSARPETPSRRCRAM
jgi:hypothetical protein